MCSIHIQIVAFVNFRGLSPTISCRHKSVDIIFLPLEFKSESLIRLFVLPTSLGKWQKNNQRKSMIYLERLNCCVETFWFPCH